MVDVRDEEELEVALERIDPEIFLLSPREAEDDEEALDRVLELLPDVPAGKLAIAELAAATPGRGRRRSSGRASTRCSSRAGDVADLVGGAPPEV